MFVYGFGRFQFELMPFRLMNASSTFQRLIQRIVKGSEFVFVYLNDVLIPSKNGDERMEHLSMTTKHHRSTKFPWMSWLPMKIYCGGFRYICCVTLWYFSETADIEMYRRMHRAFDVLRETINTSDVVLLPNFDAPFIVETDKSSFSDRAYLTQKGKDKKIIPIQEVSRTNTEV